MIHNIAELLEKYPMRNKAWINQSPSGNVFVAEASSLGIPPGGVINGAKDPWNRLFKDYFLTHHDGEGETTHWFNVTTVEGFKVECHILND
jgi:hypothetical protein